MQILYRFKKFLNPVMNPNLKIKEEITCAQHHSASRQPLQPRPLRRSAPAPRATCAPAPALRATTGAPASALRAATRLRQHPSGGHVCARPLRPSHPRAACPLRPRATYAPDCWACTAPPARRLRTTRQRRAHRLCSSAAPRAPAQRALPGRSAAHRLCSAASLPARCRPRA
jgi:hypothetical protein